MNDSSTTPASRGEKNALSGFVPQYALAARTALKVAKQGRLVAVRLLDPQAGIVDDFQIVTEGRVDAYQVKWGIRPNTFTFTKFLDLLPGMASGRAQIISNSKSSRVVVHVATNSPLSTNDSIKGLSGEKIGSMYDFWYDILRPYQNGSSPSRLSFKKWEAPLEQTQSKVKDKSVDFLTDFRIDPNLSVSFSDLDSTGLSDSPVAPADVEKVQAYLLKRASKAPDGCLEVPASELFTGSGLGDKLELRNRHEFPSTDLTYSPLVETRDRLATFLKSNQHGYAALIGPPGSGKSTLINEEFTDSTLRVVRYFAYLPSVNLESGIRGESEHFFHDMNLSLARQGSMGGNLFSSGSLDRRKQFMEHLAWLHSDYKQSKRRTVLFIDGLDHIPREQNPERSFLKDLPSPNQIPEGVSIILGTQTVELDDLPDQIATEVGKSARNFEMARLGEQQIKSIVAHEFPSLNESQHVLAQFESQMLNKTEGHPLALTIVVRQLHAALKEAIISPLKLLEAIDFVGSDIHRYYESIWKIVENENVLFDYLGGVCRDRLPIRVSHLESKLGRQVSKLFLRKCGHLLKRDPSGHLHPFHNSFWVFLRLATATNSMGEYVHARHLAHHRKLARSFDTALSPVDRWESIFHYYMAGDVQDALSQVSLERVREQVRNFRSLASIFEDLRSLQRIAIQVEDFSKVAELAVIWKEVDLYDRAIDHQYDEIAMQLMLAGEDKTALQLLTNGLALRLSPSVCMKCAVELMKNGREREGRALFFASEPINSLHELRNVNQNELLEDLLLWASIAVMFRRPEQVLQLIEGASLKGLHEYGYEAETPATVKAKLMAKVGVWISQKFTLSVSDKRLVEKIDQSVLGASRYAWLKQRTERIRNLPADSPLRYELARGVVREYSGVSTESLESFESLDVAEVACFFANDSKAAMDFVTGVTQPNHGGNYDGSLSAEQIQNFRKYRILGVLGDFPDPSQEIDRDTDNDFKKTESLLTRHVARLGQLAAKKFNGTLTESELLEDLQQVFRFMSQKSGENQRDDKFRYVRQARPAVLAIILNHVVDTNSHSSVGARLLETVMDSESSAPWSSNERLAAIEDLQSAGFSPDACREAFDKTLAARTYDNKFGAYRCEHEIRIAKFRIRLQDYSAAIQHLKNSIQVAGTVDQEHDNQHETWCRFLALANQVEPREERRLHRRSLMVKAALSLVSTDAPSSYSAMATVQSVTKQNPMEGEWLVDFLARSAAASFVETATAFLLTVVQSEQDCKSIARSIMKKYLVPLTKPDCSLMAQLFDAESTEELLLLQTQIEFDSLPEHRTDWQASIRRIAKDLECDVLLGSRAESQDVKEPEETISLGTDEKIPLSLALEQVRSPNDFLDFYKTATSKCEWVSLTPLVREICLYWDGAGLAELSQIVKDYDKDGKDTMICAEALEKQGFVDQACELAKFVLCNEMEHQGEQWHSDGSVVRAIQLLDRQISNSELRPLVLGAFHKCLGQSHWTVSAASLGMFRHAFPLACSTEEIVKISTFVKQFLVQATRFVEPIENLPEFELSTFRQALLSFVVNRLCHPVVFLADASRNVLVDLLRDGQLSDEDLVFICEQTDGSVRATRGWIAALSAVVESLPKIPFLVVQWLKKTSRVKSFGIRAECHMILAKFGETIELAEKVPADLSKFVGVPLEIPDSMHDEAALPTGYLRDTFDANQIVRPFRVQIKFLADISGLEETNLVKRVYDICLEHGRETWFEKAAIKLRKELENSGLQLSFQRLRTIVVENAIHQAAAELIDAGRIDEADYGNLLLLIRTSDPELLIISPVPSPLETPEFSPPERSSSNKAAWLIEGRTNRREVHRLPLRECEHGVVLAEWTNFFDGNTGLCEERFSNIWANSESPKHELGVLPNDLFGYVTRYQECYDTEPAVGVRHTMSMEHHGPHVGWLVLNRQIGRIIEFQPDATKQFGWTDGEDWIWTVRWMDGSPLVYPRRLYQGDGWLLVATPGVIEKLQAKLGSIKRFCSVCRRRKESTSPPSIEFWTEEI